MTAGEVGSSAIGMEIGHDSVVRRSLLVISVSN